MTLGRRTTLRALGAAAVGALAGCSDAGFGTGSDPAVGGQTAGDSWRHLGNTPWNRTYAAGAAGPGPSPEVRWSWEWPVPDAAEQSLLNYAPPVADDGLVYTVVSGRHVYPEDETATPDRPKFVNELVAVDPASAERTWRYTFAEGSLAPGLLPPATGNGTVVMASRKLHAVDAASGDRNWTVDLPGPVRGPPSIVGDEVFVTVAADDGADAVAAYDLADGTRKWTALEVVSRYAPVAVTDEAVYAPARTEVVKLDRADGTELWRSPAGAESLIIRPGGLTPVYSPVVGEDAVYVAGSFFAAVQGEAGALVSLDPSDGSENWRFQPNDDGQGTVAGVHGFPVLHDGTLYVSGFRGSVDPDAGSYDHALYAVDAADGTRQWKVPIDRSTPFQVGADGAVYLATADRVAAYSMDDGSELFDAAVGPPDRDIAAIEGVSILDDLLLASSPRGIHAVGSAE